MAHFAMPPKTITRVKGIDVGGVGYWRRTFPLRSACFRSAHPGFEELFHDVSWGQVLLALQADGNASNIELRIRPAFDTLRHATSRLSRVYSGKRIDQSRLVFRHPTPRTCPPNRKNGPQAGKVTGIVARGAKSIKPIIAMLVRFLAEVAPKVNTSEIASLCTQP